MAMDMDFDVFYTSMPWIFADTTDYFHEGIRLFPEAVANLRGLLNKKWDVIAFVDYQPRQLPSELYYLMLEDAANGAGLVSFTAGGWGAAPQGKPEEAPALLNPMPK